MNAKTRVYRVLPALAAVLLLGWPLVAQSTSAQGGSSQPPAPSAAQPSATGQTTGPHTLVLKDGRIFQGTYLGGNEDTVRFSIQGEIRVFQTSEVAAVRLNDNDKPEAAQADKNAPARPSATPSTPANQTNPPAPPVEQNATPPTGDQTSKPPAPPNPPAAAQDAVPQTPPNPPAADQGAAPATAPNPQAAVGAAPAAAQADRTPGASQDVAPASDAITVAENTPLIVRMIDSLDSGINHAGERFRASLDEDLAVKGVVVAPRGTSVYGRITYAQAAGHIQAKADMRLELTTIMINGQAHAISTGNYELAGNSRGKQSAERIGGAAIGGAIIGGILGGGEGAAAGAVVGAGAATGVQEATQPPQVRIPSETRLQFKLSANLVTEPAQPGH